MKKKFKMNKQKNKNKTYKHRKSNKALKLNKTNNNQLINIKRNLIKRIVIMNKINIYNNKMKNSKKKQ